MTLQSVVFRRKWGTWSKTKAVAWLKKYKLAYDIDTKPSEYRARQKEPRLFVPGSFRTKVIDDGMENMGLYLVLGKLK
jgi:hypothetical protein